MIGAFAHGISVLFGGGTAASFLALILSRVLVAAIGLIADARVLPPLRTGGGCRAASVHLCTHADSRGLGQMIWGADYRSIMAPAMLRN